MDADCVKELLHEAPRDKHEHERPQQHKEQPVQAKGLKVARKVESKEKENENTKKDLEIYIKAKNEDAQQQGELNDGPKMRKVEPKRQPERQLHLEHLRSSLTSKPQSSPKPSEGHERKGRLKPSHSIGNLKPMNNLRNRLGNSKSPLKASALKERPHLEEVPEEKRSTSACLTKKQSMLHFSRPEDKGGWKKQHLLINTDLEVED